MELSDFLPRFIPQARLEAVPLDPVHMPGDQCLVVDDLLLNPQALIELSVMWRSHIQAPSGSAYPGLELWMPPALTGVLDAAAFRQRWGVPAGYMHGSNDYFERVLQVPARFNRAVFYDGGLFHCSDNGPAGAMPDDPRTGRLTLNGFFNCTRPAR